MKCYFHPEIDAVAICKNCGKGICPECAADVENGMACRNSCEEKVKAINSLFEKSQNSYLTANRTYKITAVIYKNLSIWLLLIGTAFLIFGIIQGLLLLFILGILFIISAVFSFTEAQKLKKLRV